MTLVPAERNRILLNTGWAVENRFDPIWGSRADDVVIRVVPWRTGNPDNTLHDFTSWEALDAWLESIDPAR